MVKRRRGRRAAAVLLAAVTAAVLVLCSMFPLLRAAPDVLAGTASDLIVCAWSDGTRTRETYSEAYAALTGISSDGTSLEFSRGALRGKAATGDAFREAYRVLTQGTLAELLALRISGESRLELAALFREYSETAWYSGEYFRWQGWSVSVAKDRSARELVMLSGEVGSALRETGASVLVLREGSRADAAAFCQSRVTEVVAEGDYLFADGALYEHTAAGLALVAALPDVVSLTVREDAMFLREGALSPCRALEELVLPFLGTARVPYEGDSGDLGALFARTDGGYDVPASLGRVTILSGQIRDCAFAGCSSLISIDLCGIPAEAVNRQAFPGCDSLSFLHTEQADPDLPEGFSRREEKCGCFVFFRADEV